MQNQQFYSTIIWFIRKVYKIYNLDFKLSHTNKIKQNLKPSHMTHLKLISREETVSKTVRSTHKYIVQLL